ncbi:hypothetical protein [Paenibacillus sp. YYML68]|uniref:hypothetical protein n=1 Tax=Paenibacillus sp. YYML68 TaxID=2909250 RepID=UPI00248F7989|nr:hypothetical protein [Paenibacillus sp. YYML68]
MAQVPLLLMEKDVYFGEKLAAYLRTSEFADRLALHWHTSEQEGWRWIEEMKSPFIAVVHESIPLPEPLPEACRAQLWLLCESERGSSTAGTAGTAGADGQPLRILAKYQPLNRLLSSLIAGYNDTETHAPIRGTRYAATTVVYSPIGGSGKTVTAVHTAAQLTAAGERVLLLCFERLPSRVWYTSASEQGQGDADTFSKLLYYAKTRPAKIAAQLEQLKLRHVQGRFDYIPPLTYAQEWDELGAAEVQALLAGAADSGVYDHVIVDADSADTPAAAALLEAADHILWPVADDCIQLQKITEWFDARRAVDAQKTEQLRRNVIFIHNRAMGSQTVNTFSDYSIIVRGRLPYVPEWKALGRADVQLLRGFADEAVAALRGGKR